MKSPPPTVTHAPGTIRAAWSYRRFRVVFIGASLSMIGTWMQNFTLPAYVEDRAESATLVGLMIFVQLGPLLFLSIPAGMLADRVDRTRLVIAMQSTMLVLTLVIAGLIARDAPLWTIFLTQLGIGIANSLNAPAYAASIPMMVDRRDISGAVSLNSAMINGTRILGPALAALLAWQGFSIAQLLLVNAGTYLFMIVPLIFISLPQPAGRPPERGWRQLLSGVNVARRRLVISRSLMVMFLFSLVSLPHIGLFPSIARRNLDIAPTSTSYQMLYVVWGTGAFLGAIAVGTSLAHIDKRVLAPAGFAGFAFALGAFALTTNVVWAYPIALALGFVYFMTATTLVTVLQVNLADSERASVMPLWFMVFGGTVPIGNLIGGPLIDAIGARPVLLFGAAFALVLARWADFRRLGPEAFLPEGEGGEPFRPVNASRQI